MSFLYKEDSRPKPSCFTAKQHDVNNNKIELNTKPIETNYIPSSDELDEVN